MATKTVTERSPLAGYDPDDQRPLRSYAALTGVFGAAAAGFCVWVRRSGHELPERIAASDLALITLATHKASRLLAKDRVTSAVRAPFTRFQREGGPSEVEEQARGRGLRRAVGELLICPFCLSMWIGAGFAAGLVVAPRPTRWVASALTAVFGSDVLQLAYKGLEKSI